MKKYLIYILSLLYGGLLQAQITLPQELKAPIEQAINKSVGIENASIEIAKSELERKKIKSLHIPRLEAKAAYLYNDNRLTVDIPSVELPITGYELFDDKTKFRNHGHVLHGSLLAKSVLFSGFQINRGAKAIKEKAKGDEFMVDTRRDSLIVEVVNSFDQLRFIKASELLIENSDERLKKEEERVQKGIENGLAIPFDRDKIKLARLELESKKAELQGSKDLLHRKINYLTGLTEDEIKQVLYKLEPFLLDANLTVENKQELRALEHYKKASTYLLKKEKGSYLPKVAAFGGVTYSSLFNGSSTLHSPYFNGQLPDAHLQIDQLTLAPNWVIGVGLQWTIFAGTERKKKIKQAQLSIDQINNKLRDSRDKLNLLLDKKQVDYRTKTLQVEIADQQKTMAKNTLSQARKQYENGLISISERLEAENDFTKAAQKKSRALVDQRSAALEALMVTGNLSEKIEYK